MHRIHSNALVYKRHIGRFACLKTCRFHQPTPATADSKLHLYIEPEARSPAFVRGRFFQQVTAAPLTNQWNEKLHTRFFSRFEKKLAWTTERYE